MSSHFSRREFIDGAGVVAASSIFPTPAFHGLTPAHARERMEPAELRSKLRGVIAFPITPLKPDLSLDIPGLRNNLQRLLQTPIAAIVAAGGTGEMYSLTPVEHLEVVRTTAEEVHGRIPVIARTGFNLPSGIELAQQSLERKAYYVDLAPAVQFIFNSNTKVNIGYRFQLRDNDMQRGGK